MGFVRGGAAGSFPRFGSGLMMGSEGAAGWGRSGSTVNASSSAGSVNDPKNRNNSGSDQGTKEDRKTDESRKLRDLELLL